MARFAALAAPAFRPAVAAPPLPATPVRPVEDRYRGETVGGPHRGLEDGKDGAGERR